LQLADYKESVEFIQFMQKEKIQTLRHYRPLHSSDFFIDKHDDRSLNNAINFSNTLVRLPIHHEVNSARVIETVLDFFN
jgi:dTDP-4-amino-4,6-dideoxygalactose transaminase